MWYAKRSRGLKRNRERVLLEHLLTLFIIVKACKIFIFFKYLAFFSIYKPIYQMAFFFFWMADIFETRRDSAKQNKCLLRWSINWLSEYNLIYKGKIRGDSNHVEWNGKYVKPEHLTHLCCHSLLLLRLSKM